MQNLETNKLPDVTTVATAVDDPAGQATAVDSTVVSVVAGPGQLATVEGTIRLREPVDITPQDPANTS